MKADLAPIFISKMGDLKKSVMSKIFPDIVEKTQHEEKTKTLIEGTYFEIIEKMFAKRDNMNFAEYQTLLETYKTLYGESIYEMLQMYMNFMLCL